MPDQHTAAEAADLLGVSPTTVYRWAREGWLTPDGRTPYTLRFTDAAIRRCKGRKAIGRPRGSGGKKKGD